MTQQTSRGENSVWLGDGPLPKEAFGGGELWFGRHLDDDDILVLDPEETDPTAGVLALYSLSQHRIRRFPRATVEQRIQPLTDELALARAKHAYAQRVSLRDGHQRAAEEEQAKRMEHARDGMIAAHQRYVESLGLEYRGVEKTATDIRGGRATRCHVCDIALDDFVGVSCSLCSRVLCSCGACSCGKPKASSRAKRKAAEEQESES